ncbi:MAG: tetratricopeptide repeat protein [Acidobacteria bacterium]|nr:tetratricopeptide repeat protein [Acidobacteriota bacterium]
MNKNGISFGIIGIVIGLTVGFFGANYLNRNAENAGAGAPLQPQVPANMPSQGNIPSGAPLADVQKVLDRAKEEPENYQAQIEAGEMYTKIQRFDQALPFYEAAQKLKPADLNSNIVLGNGYFDAKQYEKAETYYAKALEIDPKNVGVRTDYGLTFFLREPSDPERSIMEYRKALEIDPKHELTLQNLSAALKEKGDKEELIKTLAALKEVNPNNKVIKQLESDPQ